MMTFTDKLGQVLVKALVLEVHVGDAFFVFLLALGFKALLDDMLLLQACCLGYLPGILVIGFKETALAEQKQVTGMLFPHFLIDLGGFLGNLGLFLCLGHWSGKGLCGNIHLGFCCHFGLPGFFIVLGLFA